MIIRGPLSIGLVWLLLPHHPDLGLSPAQAPLCSGYCEMSVTDNNAQRDSIMARFRVIKIELKQALEHKTTERGLEKVDRP